MTISRLLLLFLCVLFSKHLLSQKLTLIHNVNIVDGNAKPAYKAFVLIQDSKIIYIGSKKPNASIDLVIDGKGKILAPGFIDSHSHHFGDLNKNKAGLSTVNWDKATEIGQALLVSPLFGFAVSIVFMYILKKLTMSRFLRIQTNWTSHV